MVSGPTIGDPWTPRAPRHQPAFDPDLMTATDSQAPLRIARDLSIGIETDDDVTLTLGAHSRRFPRRALGALAAVAQGPRPFGEIVRQLTGDAATKLDWIEASGLVARLRAFGALTDGSAARATRKPPRLSGRDIAMHIELLDDRERTRAFIAAIERAVRPGDVVVDLGTGTGILAMAAARAGASRVYAIEASAFADVAERIIEANGHADRITVVRGWSNEIDLPERADVLVSEIIGNDPLGEGALRYMPDAVERFLKPTGTVLPARLRVMAALVDVPAAVRAKERPTNESLSAWRNAYGFDFGEFARATEAIGRPFYRLDREMEGWRWIGEPVQVFEAQLSQLLGEDQSISLQLAMEAPAAYPAVALYSVLDFGAGLILDTHPGRTRNGNWRAPVHLVPPRSDGGRGGGCVDLRATWSAFRSQVDIQLQLMS